MNTDKLKVIAEGMGYYVNPSIEEGITVDNEGHWIDYAPDTSNNDQMVEIMEKLKLCVEYMADGNYRSYPAGRMCLMETGKTINEAVCNAAFEYFK
jgi:hypothetical protein